MTLQNLLSINKLQALPLKLPIGSFRVRTTCATTGQNRSATHGVGTAVNQNRRLAQACSSSSPLHPQGAGRGCKPPKRQPPRSRRKVRMEVEPLRYCMTRMIAIRNSNFVI